MRKLVLILIAFIAVVTFIRAVDFSDGGNPVPIRGELSESVTNHN